MHIFTAPHPVPPTLPGPDHSPDRLPPPAPHLGPGEVTVPVLVQGRELPLGQLLPLCPEYCAVRPPSLAKQVTVLSADQLQQGGSEGRPGKEERDGLKEILGKDEEVCQKCSGSAKEFWKKSLKIFVRKMTFECSLDKLVVDKKTYIVTS